MLLRVMRPCPFFDDWATTAASRTVNLADLVVFTANFRIAIVDVVGHPLVLQEFCLADIKPDATAVNAAVNFDAAAECAQGMFLHFALALRAFHDLGSTGVSAAIMHVC